jgi:D-glycero-D-manno-heptose 1,7-bisphosphate phosphatase
MTRLIILDRDGVINYESIHSIRSPQQWVPIPGSLEAIARLYRAGYTIAVITNQSGIARGLLSQDTLDLIHQKMQRELKILDAYIDIILYCPHTPDQLCQCRKPRVDLYQTLAKHHRINLHNVPAIGDSLRDIQAAHTMGCRPHLVLTGHGRQTLREYPVLANQVLCHADLAACVDYLLAV